MPKNRREFLKSSAMLTLGAMSGAARGQTPVDAPSCQVPKMKFGSAEIGRLVLGSNQFNGFSHFNGTFDGLMREWFTVQRASEVMHRAASYGINAFNYSEKGPCVQDWERFVAEGGKMHLIAADSNDGGPEAMVKRLKPHALHRQ